MFTGILTSVVSILVVGGIAFMIFRSRGGSERQHAELKDAYFFFVSFVALGIIFWAIADLARVLLEKTFFTTTQVSGYYRSATASNDAYLRQISLRVSSFLVAFPVYIFHWFKANFKDETLIDKHHKRIYLFAVMIFSALLTLGMAMGMTYGLVNEVLGVSTSSKRELAYTIPYSVLGFGIWIAHYRSYSKMSKKKEDKYKLDNKPKIPPPAEKLADSDNL